MLFCSFILLFVGSSAFKPTLKPSSIVIREGPQVLIDEGVREGSIGVELLLKYLNSDSSASLLRDFCLLNLELKNEMNRLNMWTGGNFIVKDCKCVGVFLDGLKLQSTCDIKGKLTTREVIVPFPFQVTDETKLKVALIEMIYGTGRIEDTGDVVQLPFGQSYVLPKNLLFNNVPHASWVRSYIYNLASYAIDYALNIASSKTMKMSIKVNCPELNPAFDTYRLGTMLELVREIASAQVMKGMNVRVCVQQSLGEGVFAGMPVALSSVWPVMQRMDWAGLLDREDQSQESIAEVDIRRKSGAGSIRFGRIGAEEVKRDDSLIIIIAPQNVVGGSVVEPLEQMTTVAERNHIPIVLVNPILADRPSSNNVMQIRGRAERKLFADSFLNVFTMRLLYPSSGGYMFPIRGMLVKRTIDDPYVAYRQVVLDGGMEEYQPIAAFPLRTPGYDLPDATVLSDLFTSGRKVKRA